MFARLARNNAWSNRRLHRACAQLSQADFEAPRTSFFPTLQATLNHIYTVDAYYLDGLEAGGRGLALVANPIPHPRMAELAAAQATLDARLIRLCDALDAAALEREVVLDRGDEGLTRERTHAVLAHLFVHQIHHRGQAHAMLSGTAVAPPQLDEFFLDYDLPRRAGETLAQVPIQERDHLRDRLARRRQELVLHEAVRHAVEDHALVRDLRALELGDQRLLLVDQRVGGADDQERRRQLRRGAHRRDARIASRGSGRASRRDRRRPSRRAAWSRPRRRACPGRARELEAPRSRTRRRSAARRGSSARSGRPRGARRRRRSGSRPRSRRRRRAASRRRRSARRSRAAQRTANTQSSNGPGERRLGREPVVDVHDQVAGLGEAQAELAVRAAGCPRPSRRRAGTPAPGAGPRDRAPGCRPSRPGRSDTASWIAPIFGGSAFRSGVELVHHLAQRRGCRSGPGRSPSGP